MNKNCRQSMLITLTEKQTNSKEVGQNRDKGGQLKCMDEQKAMNVQDHMD